MMGSIESFKLIMLSTHDFRPPGFCDKCRPIGECRVYGPDIQPAPGTLLNIKFAN